MNSNLNMLNLLIDHNANTSVTDMRGQSLLHLAIYQRDKDICQRLISIGLDVNICDREGSTPLHVAAEINDAEVVKILLENNADVNKTDYDNYTPLHVAARVKNSTEVLELLLNKRAKADSRTCHKDLPLHIAAATGKTFLFTDNWFMLVSSSICNNSWSADIEMVFFENLYIPLSTGLFLNFNL